MIASIPIAITGFLFKDIIDIFFSSTLLIGIFLLITSLMLFGIFQMLNKKKIFSDEISYLDSLIIGVFQGLAIFPGISRSGSTFFSGVTRNIHLNSLFDFSCYTWKKLKKSRILPEKIFNKLLKFQTYFLNNKAVSACR